MSEHATMKEWRQDKPLFYRFRWWLFKRLSEFGWWVAPEPEKSMLKAYMDLSKTEREELTQNQKD